MITDQIFSDIFKLIEIVKDQNRKLRDFCETPPEPRRTLYKALFSTFPDKFFPLTMPSGEIRLTPYQPSIWLYRGQSADYGKCPPSLYRNDPSEIDLLIARIKEIQFESVLGTHPAVIDIIKNGFHVNFKGLAQHYSLKTELLDLTSDILVAAFFATCSYSCEANKYLPRTGSQIGVVYKTLQLALSSHPEANNKMKFDIVGLQPFCRPAEQKAYSYVLYSGETFPAHKLMFRQSRKSAEKVYEIFEGGEKLFPEDSIAQKASEISASRSFDQTSILSAIERYGFNGRHEEYFNGLSKRGFSISTENPHLFSEMEKNKLQTIWLSCGKNEFFSKIMRPPLFSI